MFTPTRLAWFTLAGLMAAVPALAVDSGESTIHIISTCTSINNFVDLGPPGPSTGDLYDWVDELFTPDHAQKVGEAIGRFNLIDWASGEFAGSIIAVFDDGTITMEMVLYNVPGKVSVGAITGGTGRYVGARGEISVTLGNPCGPHDIYIRMRSSPLKLSSTSGPMENSSENSGTPAFSVSSRPNPFRSSTDLEVDLPSSSDVSVDVYDVAGRRVNSFTVGNAGAGKQVIPLAGTDERGRPLASGVYFCKVSAVGATVTHKIVIAR